MVFGSNVIVAPTRADVIVPADDQLPLLELGSNTMADDCTVDPFRPPATRIFPLVFCSALAMCCSRGLEIDASVLNAFWTGSNNRTDATVAVPLLPPTKRTWLLSWLFDVWISVAV
jgi:hypothetical protein